MGMHLKYTEEEIKILTDRLEDLCKDIYGNAVHSRGVSLDRGVKKHTEADKTLPEIITGIFSGYVVYTALMILLHWKKRRLVYLFWVRYVCPMRRIPLYVNHKDEDIRQAVKERLGRNDENI